MKKWEKNLEVEIAKIHEYCFERIILVFFLLLLIYLIDIKHFIDTYRIIQ